MGKCASVHTFIAAAHASRCLFHLTGVCILPARKMFLDLSEPHRAPDRIPSNRKMFIDLSGVRSIAGHTLPTTGRMFLDRSWLCLSPQPHSVNLKNVHRSIRSSPHHSPQAGHRMNVPGPIRLQVSSRSNSVNLGNEIAFLIGAVQEILSRNVQAAGRRPRQGRSEIIAASAVTAASLAGECFLKATIQRCSRKSGRQRCTIYSRLPPARHWASMPRAPSRA
jgi:hypothetical protein